uniref:Cytohesin Ubiquitin Protein Inducing domain-containing protein n=1 Tax=Electrophorus electricus TaxID=8005 RepID=A0A4W4EXC1_ELEEL
MEAKEETSDTDSGIILHSGPDSPSTVMKDVGTRTRAVKLKHQSLQDRLELCILELKKLCIREAELTGHLSSDYPVLPGEKPPLIRRRIGAAFKLDEQSFLHRGEDSELSAVEAELALQQQIYTAARRLCQEEPLGKAVKRSRVQQCRLEEQKLKELQGAVFQLRLQRGRSSPRPPLVVQKRERGASDDSSLSDSAVMDEEELTSQSSQVSSEPPPVGDPCSVPLGPPHRPLTPTGPFLLPPEPNPHQTPPVPLKALHACPSPIPEHDPAPIQNSPWKESSLDKPYEKQKKSHSSSTKSSPAVTPTLPSLEACFEVAGLTLQIPTHASLRHSQSSTILEIPNSEMARNVEQDRGRPQRSRRRLTDVNLMSPDYSSMRLAMGNPLYSSSCEDSSSEHSSTPSHVSSPCLEYPTVLQIPCQDHYRYHYSSHTDSHMPQSYVPLSYYKNSSPQLSPSIYTYVDEGRGNEVDMDRMYIRHQLPPSCNNTHYEYWYDEAPPHQQLCRLIPPHVKVSRTPSLREYPHHPNKGLPRQVVSEELKSWHQRSQLRTPRPHSLDRHRQGAMRFRNTPGRESPLSQQHSFQEQQVKYIF